MEENRLLELLTRKATGTITLAEIRELQLHLKQHPEDLELSQALEAVWQTHFDQQHSYSEDQQETFIRHLHQKIGIQEDEIPALPLRTTPLRWRKRLLRAAAILFICMGIGAVFYLTQHRDPAKTAPYVHMTRKGSKSVIELPDGTSVWLNADSRLTYAKTYGDKTRTVTLSGEAYFEVVHDADIPFIVQTKAMDVRVLGTTFNIRAYDEDITTQATLIKGKVEVYLRNKEKEKIVLKPHEKLLVKNITDASTRRSDGTPNAVRDNTPEMSVVTIGQSATADSLANEIQWTQNRLVFDQTGFREIIPELERWYGVNITVSDSSLYNRKLSGIFENESLTEVLQSFQLAVGFRYKLSDNTLTLY
ncbi:FecR domain-containing protein [Niabella terrae]